MKPIAPKSSWPLVSVGDAAPVAVATASPFEVPEPISSNPYDDYLVACSVAPPTNCPPYVAGFLSGFALLTGGMAPDVAAAKAAHVLREAAIAKGKDNFGQGATDVWRLVGEAKAFKDVKAGQ